LENKEINQGQYISVRCPNCGHRLHIIIEFCIFPDRRRRIVGQIENYLSQKEFLHFKTLNMHDKLVFSVGLFHQKYGKWPCEKELEKFMGLSVQTISKYINKMYEITSKQQEREINGKFEKKIFSLNEDGSEKFGKLVYSIMSENFLNCKKETVHA
jgi:hypothetical protein